MASQPKLNASDFIPKGIGAREYGKFRAPRYDEVAVAVVSEGNAAYLASKNATALGATEVIATPGAGKCLRIKTLMVNNAGTDQVAVSFREGAVAVDKFLNSLSQYGAMWNLNLIGAYWILAPNTALNVYLAAGSSDINVQAGYDIVEAIPVEALTDAQEITEDLELELVEG